MSAGLRTRPSANPELRPSTQQTTPPPADAEGPPDALLPVLALMTAACLPLARAFVGWGFLRPVLGAVLLAVGLSWGARRLGGGPVLALVVNVLGWAVFCSAAFLSHTTLLGVVPSGDTIGAARDLWVQGVALIRAHPAPVHAAPALLFLTVTGVWAVAHAVEGLLGRLDAPVKAIVLALTVWVVPVMVTVDEGSAVPWTVPFLAAAALVLFLFSGTDVHRWGTLVTLPGSRQLGGPRFALAPSASLIAGAAALAGVLLAGVLPGFGEPPWYELRGVGSTTLTTNPIVNIRPSLVASDGGPVMRVTTPRPVYLRTTSLDVYSEVGEWTNAGIRGNPVGRSDGTVPPETEIAATVPVDVQVEVVDLPGAVLVPAPYQPRGITGEIDGTLQYDRRLATLTTDRDVTLQPGDRYTVAAALPNPPPEVADLDVRGPDDFTRLPPNVPQQVTDLAARIVSEAGATTVFDQALAIQQHLRAWTYSLDPPAGHSGDAMLSFIEQRIGYCEQYAGTMAVMLRTLGIPARVAVGFTPGVRDEDTYVVTNENAHAWVEVLFPGHGWLAFEPTPRDDDNVLRPSADDPAPARTLAQQQVEEEVSEPPEDAPAETDLAPEAGAEDPDPPDTDPEDPAAAEEGGEGPTGSGWLLLTLLGGLIGLGAALAAVQRRRQATRQPPHLRVLAARGRVGRIGRGLGMPAVHYETDHEYLHRLTAAAAAECPRRAAHTLADRAAQARYAPDLPAAAADDAEAAAGVLQEHLLAGHSAPRRAWVRVRAAWSSTTARVRARWARRRGRDSLQRPA